MNPFQPDFNNSKAHGNHIIIDRKKKRHYLGMDDNWVDPLGIEQARKNKLNTLEVDKSSDNIIDKFLMEHETKDLLGKKIWAVKNDNSRMFCGWVTNVYPSRILLVKVNGNNLPIRFQDVISIEKGE